MEEAECPCLYRWVRKQARWSTDIGIEGWKEWLFANSTKLSQALAYAFLVAGAKAADESSRAVFLRTSRLPVRILELGADLLRGEGP